MKDKLKIIILVLLIINLIILIILINILFKNKFNNIKNINQEEYISSVEYNYKIYPVNHSEYEKLFQNKENYGKVYSFIYSLLKYIPDLYNTTQNMHGSELKEFYNERKEFIKLAYHINTEEDFILFINKCRIIKTNYYKKVTIEENMLKKANNNVNADFTIEYENINFIINIEVKEIEDKIEINMHPIDKE